MKYHVHFNIWISFKREVFSRWCHGNGQEQSQCVLCPSPSEPCCVGGGTAGVQEGATGVLGVQWQPQGVSAVCVGLQSPSTGRRRSAASPPWAATPSGGSGTPQSVSTWPMAPLPCSSAGPLRGLFALFSTAWLHHLSLRDGNLERDLFQLSVNCFLLIT